MTIGSASSVVEYLKVMVDQLLRLTRQDRGIDQGLHNYVLYKGLGRNARVISNGDGPEAGVLVRERQLGSWARALAPRIG